MVDMLEHNGLGRYKNQIVCLVLYFMIAITSVIYTKTANAANTGETEVEMESGKLKRGDERLQGSYDKRGDNSGSQSVDKIISVPLLSQEGYPTGCESVTSVMALQYAGVDVSVDDFIDNYLRIGTYYEEDGQYFGNSPYYYFIGDPRTGSGFGCFAPVIHDALSEAAGTDRVRDLTGMTLEGIAEGYIAEGIPVIIWATINMQPSYEGGRWTILETGKRYTWPAEEHCLLLVGTDKEYYYFNDPEEGEKMVKYRKKAVEQRYLEMGSQALAVLPEK